MFQLSSPLRKRDIFQRCFTLSVCSSPLIGAYFLSYNERSSPFQCLFLHFTGIPCPGCGLTRSFSAIAQFNLQEALHYHLFGPLLFLAFTLTSVHLVLELSLRCSVIPFYGKLLRRQDVQLTLLGLVLIYHCLRLGALFLSGELAVSFALSPLGQFLKSLIVNFS